MKVLIVTNMFPDKKNPYNGIFVAEQIDAIRTYHPGISFDVCYIDGRKGKLEYLKSIFYVNQKIRKGDYDLIHIHFGLSGIYLLWPFRKQIPTLVTFHGSDIQPKAENGSLTLQISRYAAKSAHCCITLNQEMDALVKNYNPNTRIVPCSIDTHLFRPAETKKDTDCKKIIFPCNHGMKVKNYPLFCRVLSLLREKYGIACEEIELKGFSRPQVAKLFSEADLLLMTSNSEGSPQAVKEAMACNLPVVSTPVGDVGELLQDVRHCYVSQQHDAEELAALCIRSFSLSGMGMSGREKIQEMKLDDRSIAYKIYEIYTQMTGR